MEPSTPAESLTHRPAATGDALAMALRAAAREAESTGLGALLRVHRPLNHDPFEAGQPFAGGGDVFTWADPRGGLEFAALGVLDRTTPTGPRRFDGARQICAAWRKATVEAAAWGHGAPADDLPFAVMWFAFAERGEGGIWDRWPRAEIRLPERIVYRRKHQGELRFGEIRMIPVAFDSEADEVDIAGALRAVSAPFVPFAAASGEAVSPVGFSPEAGPMDPRWRAQVEAARGAIRQGRLSKVVLARPLTVQAPAGQRFDLAATAEALGQLDAQAVTFGVSAPHEGEAIRGAFLGATPEVLLRVRDRWLSTHALAGTAPKDEAPDQGHGAALMASAKDRHEHALVVDALRGALSPYCERVEAAPRPRLRSAGPVQHLETPISARLAPRASVLSLLGRLHPTPALGGTPKAEALRWLEAHEGWDRGPYGAPIGWLAPSGDAAFAVAIRSALVQPDRAHLFIGAGLVADSDPEGEWRETALKARAVGEALRVGGER